MLKINISLFLIILLKILNLSARLLFWSSMKKIFVKILLIWVLVSMVAAQVAPLLWSDCEKEELVEKETKETKEKDEDDFIKKILFFTDLSSHQEYSNCQIAIQKTPYFHYSSPFTAIYLEITVPPPDAALLAV